MIIYNKKKYKQITFQKFEFSVKELTFLVLILASCFVIGFLRFKNYKAISYETTDSAFHYKTSIIYSQNLQLLDQNNSSDELYGSFRGLTGFYVNCGLAMKVFNNYPGYKVYIFFDILILFLISSTFYVTCLKIKQNKGNNFILFVVSMLYCCGYPLNSMIFGFGYLGPGILATNLVILTWLLIDKEKDKMLKRILYCLLLVFNYGLFFSYYLFVPVVYLAQGLYIIYKFCKHDYKFKELFAVGFFTLIIPFIIGIIYFILPTLFKSGTNNMSTLYASEGYIYRDLWSNFILIIPLFLYSIVHILKKKKIDICIFTFIILVAFIILTFIAGFLFNKVSSYYFFKSYYIFWLLIYLIIVKLINMNDFNSKLVFHINIYFIVFVLAIMILNIESLIQRKNNLFNNSYAAASVTNIYWFNSSRALNYNPIFNSEQLKIIDKAKNKYLKECLNDKKEFPIISGTLEKLWFYSLTNIVPIYNHEHGNLSKFYDEKFDFNSFDKDENSQCLIIFGNYDIEKEFNYLNFDEKYQIIYENSGGKIIKKIVSEV